MLTLIDDNRYSSGEEEAFILAKQHYNITFPSRFQGARTASQSLITMLIIFTILIKSRLWLLLLLIFKRN